MKVAERPKGVGKEQGIAEAPAEGDGGRVALPGCLDLSEITLKWTESLEREREGARIFGLAAEGHGVEQDLVRVGVTVLVPCHRGLPD